MYFCGGLWGGLVQKEKKRGFAHTSMLMVSFLNAPPAACILISVKALAMALAVRRREGGREGGKGGGEGAQLNKGNVQRCTKNKNQKTYIQNLRTLHGFS